jgi:hypothetical protein
LTGATNMATLGLAVLTACGLPIAYHLPCWQLTFCYLHGSSGSLSQLYTLTSQWMLAETPELPYTAWPPRLSFEISMESSMCPYFLHSTDLNQASCGGCQSRPPTVQYSLDPHEP